ncbi:MAG: hypothetical protein NT065_05740 [Chlamydiae bacterium]|nr:hypothetical protein [Chlamydiota bacterium]
MNKCCLSFMYIGVLLTGCQEKEQEPVDWDRIVHVDDEQQAEWVAPDEGSILSADADLEESQNIENQTDQYAR